MNKLLICSLVSKKFDFKRVERTIRVQKGHYSDTEIIVELAFPF